LSAGKHIATALTIAGSDSGGGAGIQADLRTFSSLGVFGCSAITALTSQNPLEVRRVDAIPVEGVKAQIETVSSQMRVAAVKTGMLYSAGIVKAVAETLSKIKAPLVVDPVAVSTSGVMLLKSSAVGALKTHLLPLADWMTPNIPEAELLLGRKISCESAMAEAALECHERWDCSCIVKGGHAVGDAKHSVDIVCHKCKLYRLVSKRVEVKAHSDHGTGCTFSAALAALLANGAEWEIALVGAKAFVLASLAEPRQVSPKISVMFPPEGVLPIKSVSLERL